jgi:nitrogen regulatory protein PII 1
MKMIRAFIRPEKEQEVVLALEGAGFPSLTKVPVRERQTKRIDGRSGPLRRAAEDTHHDGH